MPGESRPATDKEMTMKIERRPSTALLPNPVVLVSAAGGAGDGNFLTIAWVGTVCSSPPMVSVAIRPSRYSHDLVSVSREFVVNIPDAEQLEGVDVAGVWSGREHDKFAELGFTALPASKVGAPLIAECPVNLECVVRHQLALGSHDLFIAEIVATHYDEEVLDSRGRLKASALHPFALVGSEYWSLGERIGLYGAAAKARTKE
jgi:flavin reductase (DIM6/NTAB) family NADH-FMN oxidoreductase RutF